MILNLRPCSIAALNVVVEDMGERFPEEQQEEIMIIIAEVLGQFPAAEEAEEQNGDAEGADVSMQDGAAATTAA